MVALLVILGGATAGLIAARDQAPRTSTPEADVLPTDSPLKAVTYASNLEWEVAGKGAVDAGERDAETAKGSPEADHHVEKNATGTAGNGALVNGANGGVIEKPAQYGQDVGSVSWSETGGSPEALPRTATNQASPLLEKAQLKYPNLGSRLNDLAVRVEEGEASAQEAADGAAVQREGSVAVTVYLSGNVASVAGFLEYNGSDPRNVGEDYVEAYVPVTLLGELSEQQGVLRVREIIPASPDGASVGRSPACDEKLDG